MAFERAKARRQNATTNTERDQIRAELDAELYELQADLLPQVTTAARLAWQRAEAECKALVGTLPAPSDYQAFYMGRYLDAFNGFHSWARLCVKCGRPFALPDRPSRATWKYCSDPCSNRAYALEGKRRRKKGEVMKKMRGRDYGDGALDAAEFARAKRLRLENHGAYEDAMIDAIDAKGKVKGG